MQNGDDTGRSEFHRQESKQHIGTQHANKSLPAPKKASPGFQHHKPNFRISFGHQVCSKPRYNAS
jgi:hypothetical protein